MPTVAGKKREKQAQPLDLQTAIEQATRYVRPEEGVSQPRFLGAIYGVYAALPDDTSRATLMTNVLTASEFARFARERTPIADYPELPEGLTEEYLEHEMHAAPDGVHEGWDAAEAEFADEPRDPESLGRIAVAFMNKFTDIRARAHALLHTFALHELIEWPAVELQFDKGDVSQGEYQDLLWEHRIAIAQTLQTIARTKTKSGVAEAILKLGSTIPNDRTRTIVVGYVIATETKRKAEAIAEQTLMLAQLKQAFGALLGGRRQRDNSAPDGGQNGPGIIVP